MNSRTSPSAFTSPEFDGSFKNKRVAFVALTFGDASKKEVAGIIDIAFVGTTATLKLDRPLARSTATFVQVLGGDYVSSESSSIGSNENITVKLYPRCSRFIAEIPAHKAPIESVSFRSVSFQSVSTFDVEHSKGIAPSLEPQMDASGWVRDDVTCQPASDADRLSRIVSLELPFTPANEVKWLTVKYATRPNATTSEVQWTDSTPPTPLKLGVRSIQFRWHRSVSCLAERWSEPTPPSKSKVETWNQSCPRATLSDSTVCSVVPPQSSDGAGEPDTCEYRCEIDKNLEALALPITVTFDRVRANPISRQPEIVYSWHDTLEYSGQELTSMVAPADRRVMLEFKDPSDWRDRDGDEIDTIKIVSGQSSNQIELGGRDKAEVPPRWVSLPTVGRTCTDRVRVAVVGTRRYDDTTFEVKDGRVELARPYDYRPHLLFYGLLGSGATFRQTSNLRSATFGDLGLGGQYDLGGPWSLDVELTGQLTHTFYGGLELPGRPPSDLLAVPYLRFDARGALEWWHHRRFGAAMGAGLGLGTPLRYADADLVGGVELSALIEAQPLIFTMFPRRLWFLAGTGFRLFEQHIDHRIDFMGSPTRDVERDAQWYVFLRFRGALE